jgi:hypothetical protein
LKRHANKLAKICPYEDLPVFIDTALFEDRSRGLRCLVTELRERGFRAVPVTGPELGDEYDVRHLTLHSVRLWIWVVAVFTTVSLWIGGCIHNHGELDFSVTLAIGLAEGCTA